MGKFLDPKEKYIVNQYVDSYLQGTDLYSKYVDNSPTFVTYYSKDNRSSTEDPGLGGVVEVIGNESPIKYNKIENVPLFSLDEILPAIEYDESTGLGTSMESSALVLPHTIDPQPDDFLMISYHDNDNECYRRIFRVDNVEMSSLSSKTFYKITFSVEDIDIDILENRQIQDEYGLIYENIGTEKNSIVIKKDLMLLDEFEGIKEELFKKYYLFFYNKKINSFCYTEDNENFLYNPYLSRFIRNNDLFIEKRTFLKNLYIEDLLDRYKEYEFSLYNLIENRGEKNIRDDKFMDSFIGSRITTSIFSLYPENYYETFLTMKKRSSSNKNNKKCNCRKMSNKPNSYLTNDTTFFDCNDISDFIKNYENINSLTDLNSYDKIILLYLLDFDTTDNETFFKEIINIKVKDDLKSYNFLPVIFFIVKEIYNRIFTS